MTENKLLHGILDGLKENKIIIVFFILSLLIALSTPVFLTPRNLFNVLRQVSIITIAASGFTLMIITGSIDLSIGSVIAVTGLCCASLLKMNIPIVLCIIITLLLGAILGALTGIIVTGFKLNAFIVTLAIMEVYRGLSWLYCKGVPIFDLPPKFSELGVGYIGVLPIPVIIMLLCCIIMALLLNKTRYGRNVCTIGGNINAARVSGLNVRWITIQTFILTAVMSSFAGIVTTARMNQARPDAGVGTEMDVIAAVVIGGTSLSGGKGTIMGTLVGCLIIGVINNGLTINGVSPYVTRIAKGALILIAVIIDSSANNINFRRKPSIVKKS
jgi:ribose transport system permease protein